MRLIIIRIILSIVSTLLGKIIADQIHGLIFNRPVSILGVALAAPSDFVGFGLAQYFFGYRFTTTDLKMGKDDFIG